MIKAKDGVPEMVRLYHSGENLRQIATKFGITAPTVGRYLKLRGVQRRPAGRRVTTGPRRCWKCRQWKPLAEFQRTAKEPTGRGFTCTECGRAMGRVRSTFAQYGITRADFDRMYLEQDGKCAVCGKPQDGGRRLSIGHSHETGRIRGLLCRRCNLGIGHLHDDPDLLRKAIAYLVKV